jgi:hypothetical protein
VKLRRMADLLCGDYGAAVELSGRAETLDDLLDHLKGDLRVLRLTYPGPAIV